MENGNLRRKKFDYKWVIVALCFLMVMICLGFCSSNKSIYLNAITGALGISRGAFSINDSCRFITTAIVNMFFGTLVYRYGTKKLIAAGFLSLILSMLIYSFATNIFVFYIGGVLLGLGMSWTTTTMVGSIVNKWCKENKGTIMGAVLAANGLGGAIAAQIISPIIYEEGNPFGYQNAYRLVALILFVVAVIIMIFYRENPKGYVDDGKPQVHKKKPRGEGWVGISFEEAITKPYFYGAAICIFLTGMLLQGINGAAAPHMYDVGLDAGFVATMLSVHSLALAGFKFLTGFIYDRAGLRVTMNICITCAVLVMLVLTFITNSFSGQVLAMVYGVFSSLALPLETIMLPIYAGDLFGQKSYNKILGIFVSINTAGYAVGAPLMNLTYDVLGSYRTSFFISAVLMLLVGIALQFVLINAKKERTLVLEREEKLKAEKTANINA